MSAQKEDNQNRILETFMARRTVALYGEINQQSVGEVGQRMITLQDRSPDRINLLIDSGGGSMHAALGLCDLMSTVLTAPVRGIALGACGSAATFVMLYCNERISTPYSRFLIHSGTRSKITVPIGQATSENLEQLLKEVKSTEETVLRLYMNRLTPVIWSQKKVSENEKKEYVQKLISRGDQPFDDWMTAKEAVDVGLITSIANVKLDIFKD